MRLPVASPPREPGGFDAVALGLNATDNIIVVPDYPASGSKTQFVSHQVLFGGQCASAMVALSRLGLRTRYIGRVGSDDFGRQQIASIVQEGVDCSECRVVDGVASQLSFILVDAATAERTVVWKRDSRVSVDVSSVEPNMVRNARSFHCDGHNVAAERAMATWARESGIPTSIDVDKDYGGEALYPQIDYLIASSEFPERMTGVRDRRTGLAALRDRFGCPLVAMTLGREGVLALCDGQYVSSPGFRVDAVDSTGAGDAFHAGFLFGLLEGMELEDTLRVANAVAALNCTRLGARGGLPTRSDLEAFLRSA